MDVDGPNYDEHDASPEEHTTTPATEVAPATSDPDPDLERIAGDLADIDRALDRLDDGSYWTDEVTGEPLPDQLLAADPTARRTAYTSRTTDDPPASA